MRKIEMIFLFEILLGTISASAECPFLDIADCGVVVPKHPVATVAPVVYAGVNEAQCVNKMAEFQWDLALFCPSSLFCAFGLDLNGNFFSVSLTEFFPLDEVCKVFVNLLKLTCETVEKKLYQSAILPGLRDFFD